MAADMGVPFLGRLPLDPAITEGGDSGKPFAAGDDDSQGAKNFKTIVEKLISEIER